MGVPKDQEGPQGWEMDPGGGRGRVWAPHPCSGLMGAPTGVRQAGPGAAATVPVPVLVGCVLGAFALGALATGLLAACCRRPTVPKGPPEPPAAPRPPAQPPVPRLYPQLPPQGGAGGLRDPPELPTPEATPQPPTKTPRERVTHLGTPGCPEPPGPGPPTKATLEELLQRLHGPGGSGWPVTPPGSGSFANRVQPGAPFASLPPAPRDGAPRRLDVPPDSPPPPRRPLAQRHSLGGTGARPPGLARGLTRMYSLGAPGGPPWGPRPGTLERSLSMKPPVLPKPLLVPAAPGQP